QARGTPHTDLQTIRAIGEAVSTSNGAYPDCGDTSPSTRIRLQTTSPIRWMRPEGLPGDRDCIWLKSQICGTSISGLRLTRPCFIAATKAVNFSTGTINIATLTRTMDCCWEAGWV